MHSPRSIAVRLGLGPKIAIAVAGVLLLSTTVLTALAVSDVATLWAYLESSHNDTFLPYQQVEEINDALERTEVAILTGVATTPAEWPAKQALIDRERRLIAAGLETYKSRLTLGAQPEMRALLKGYRVLDEHITREQDALAVLTAGIPRLNDAIDSVSRLAVRDDDAAARVVYEERAGPLFERLIAATTVLMAIELEESGYAARGGRAVMQRTEQSLGLTVVMTLVLALFTILWLTRHITRPLRALVVATQAVQRGDLSQSVGITTHDELGVLAAAFNQMTAALRAERDGAQRYLAALRTAEERTRFALEAARVGIWDMDFATGALQWSEIMESHYGLKPGSFGGTFEAFFALVHPKDREALRELMASASRSGADFTLSHRALWPDGTVRWINGAGRIGLDTRGQPVRGVGVSLDVTDLRIEQLRVLRMTMRTVQDIVSNALMSLYAFRAEAEPHVSPESLELFDHIIADTAARLRTIGDLETVAENPMAVGMGIAYPGSSTGAD